MAKKRARKAGKKKPGKNDSGVRARPIKMNLKGLQQLLIDHHDAMMGRKVKRVKGGSTVPNKDSDRDLVIAALDSAAKSLSLLCEQGILAIEIEP